jgi:hypothetical protein
MTSILQRYEAGDDEGIVLQPYDRSLHSEDSVSRRNYCAQGGYKTCPNAPVHSVTSDHYNVATCSMHVYGALEQARTCMITARGRALA